jgi:hypothetical protein
VLFGLEHAVQHVDKRAILAGAELQLGDRTGQLIRRHHELGLDARVREVPWPGRQPAV